MILTSGSAPCHWLLCSLCAAALQGCTRLLAGIWPWLLDVSFWGPLSPAPAPASVAGCPSASLGSQGASQLPALGSAGCCAQASCSTACARRWSCACGSGALHVINDRCVQTIGFVWALWLCLWSTPAAVVLEGCGLLWVPLVQLIPRCVSSSRRAGCSVMGVPMLPVLTSLTNDTGVLPTAAHAVCPMALSAVRARFTHPNPVVWLLHLAPSLLSRYRSASSSCRSAGRETGRNNFSTMISN